MLVIEIDGPGSLILRGLSSRTTSAVITLVTLAEGSGCSLPELAMKPRPETPIAATPVVGHWTVGATPAVVVSAGRPALAAIAGMGRK